MEEHCFASQEQTEKSCFTGFFHEYDFMQIAQSLGLGWIMLTSLIFVFVPTCAEFMWQHKGAGGFITFLRPFFRKQTLSKQKLPAAKELETE